MCGIFGAWNLDGAPVHAADVERSRDALRNRGPDDAGLWVDGAVGLGHRRLSILDLSAAGRQPMAAGGRFHMVFNGEVYNFAELRETLLARGHSFSTGTDSEVVLAAFSEWGHDAFQRFSGMFALGIWDGRLRQMTLARGPMGKKPLYWSLTADRHLLFASTLAPIMAWPRFEATPDKSSIDAYLLHGSVPCPRSILASTWKLLPGESVTVNADGQAHRRRFWDVKEVAVAQDGCGPRTRRSALTGLDAVLQDAVRKRLVADVPVGAFLSGGVDSALVVAMIAKVATRDVKAYTIGFRNKQHDESSAAAEAASHLGIEHQTLFVDEKYVIDLVDQVALASDEPMADASILPTLALCRLAAEHVTVALSGDGGDEPFLGYPKYLHAHLAGLGHSIPQILRASASSRSMRYLRRPGFNRWLRLYSEGDAAYVFSRTGYWRGQVSDHSLPLIRPDLAAEYGADVAAFQRSLGLGPAASASVFDLCHTLPNAFLCKMDRASMHHGLEVRSPFMDPAVVEYGCSLSTRVRMRHLELKSLTRALLARYLPREWIDRPKKGFSPPLGEWLRTGLATRMREMLAPERVETRGYADPIGVAIAVDQHLKGQADHAQMLWGLMVLEQWFQTWMDPRRSG